MLVDAESLLSPTHGAAVPAVGPGGPYVASSSAPDVARATTHPDDRPDAGAQRAGRHALAALPPRLRNLVNPAVLAERAAAVEARLADDARTRVLRRRCAEVIATHLLKTLDA
jgi:hypothetical protein